MSDVYVSVVEAAEMLGVHPQRIHQRIREGSLPAEKVGNQWVVEMDDFAASTATQGLGVLCRRSRRGICSLSLPASGCL